MKKAIVLLACVVLLGSVLSGCATSFKTTNGKLSYGEIKGEEKGDFQAKEKYFYILSPYIAPLSTPYEELDTMIEPAVTEKGGNAATNVEVREGFSAVDLIITSLTGGLFGIRYVEVSGTAVAQ